MDNCSLSSTGLQDIDANEIEADNITILLSIIHNIQKLGWYNVNDRFDNLNQCMSDTPDSIINFDATHNAVIRVGEQEIVNQIIIHVRFIMFVNSGLFAMDQTIHLLPVRLRRSA